MTLHDSTPTAGTIPTPDDFHTGKHAFQMLTIIIGIASLFSFAFQLSRWGLLDLAAGALTVFLSVLVQLMLRRGLVSIPKSLPSHDVRISEGLSAIAAIAGLVRALLERSSILLLSAYALGATVGWLILRLLLGWALTIFDSALMAAAIGGMVAAVVTAPVTLHGVRRALRRTLRTEA